MTKTWPARVAAFFIWALAALSASFWFTQVSGTSRHASSATTLAPDTPSVQTADLARVFGPAGTATAALPDAPNPVVDAAARLRLIGVVANRAQAGVALISVDGQPPRPYRVGSALEGGWKLQKVSTRSATLIPADNAAATVTIELAPLPGAPTGGVAGVPKFGAPLSAPAVPTPAAAAMAIPASPATAGDDDTSTRN